MQHLLDPDHSDGATVFDLYEEDLHLLQDSCPENGDPDVNVATDDTGVNQERKNETKKGVALSAIKCKKTFSGKHEIPRPAEGGGATTLGLNFPVSGYSSTLEMEDF